MSDVKEQHGKLHQFLQQHSVVALALASALLILAISYFSLSYIAASHEQLMFKHLNTELDSTTELLTRWQRQNIGAAKVLASSPTGEELFVRLLIKHESGAEIQNEVRQWIYPLLLVLQYDGYSVIDLDRRIVSASSEQFIGRVAQTPENLEIMERSLRGEPAISRPAVMNLPINGPRGAMAPGALIQNLCLTLTEPGTKAMVAIGFLCVRFNPDPSFFGNFVSHDRADNIYAINRAGDIITPPKLDVPANARYQLNWMPSGKLPARLPREDELATPGPFTRLIEMLLQNKPAQIKGYADYRGRQVIGMARWLPEMNLGIVAESEIEQAFAPYLASRNVIVGLTCSALLLILVLTTSSVLNRRSLASREALFRSLLKNLPASVYMVNLDGRITVVNAFFCNLIKLHRDHLLWRHLRDIPLSGWQRQLVPERLQIMDDFQSRDETLEITIPNGELKFFRRVQFPITTHTGEPPEAVACIIIDITDRMLSNRRLDLLNQELEHSVNARTYELMVAKDEALAASKVKADFLANMSHEIRTPLNAIIGLAHLSLRGNPDDKLRVYLEKMRGSGEHLLNIINDILNFSRLEAGKLKLDREELVIEQVIDQAVDLIWERADAKGLAVKVEIDPRVPSVLAGDPLRLGQILINLAANAVKFTDSGSIVLEVKLLHDLGHQVEVLISVTDTGIGIAEDKLGTLFQPFQQVDNSSARRFEGTGLGLSICKNLAELMAGELTVESELGRGSSFRLQVRLDKSLAVPAAVAGDSPLTVVTGRVLVVEDNPLNQEIISSLLQTMGVQVSCVGSGPAAITAAAREKFDLVLMDIQLPGMDGVTACREIHWHLATRNLPIVAVTANALPGDRERYLASGLNDYISKPIDPNELHRLLIRWLSPGASAAVAAQAQAAAPAKTFVATSPVIGQNYLLAEVPDAENKITSAAEVKVLLPAHIGLAAQSAEKKSDALNVSIKNATQPMMEKNNPVTNSDVAIPSTNESPSVAPQADTKSNQSALRGFDCLHSHNIDTERALHNLMGNEQLYRRLLERFARERAEFGVQLEELLAGVGTETHNEEALNNVHSLKSLAGSLGMLKLESIAALLEQQLRNGQAPKELVTELREEITAMAHAVVEAFES